MCSMQHAAPVLCGVCVCSSAVASLLPAASKLLLRAVPPRCGVQAKTKELKSSFNEQFGAVHELCLLVLNSSQKPDLIRATLATLHAFLSWVPLGYIFESNVIEVRQAGVGMGRGQGAKGAVRARRAQLCCSGC